MSLLRKSKVLSYEVSATWSRLGFTLGPMSNTAEVQYDLLSAMPEELHDSVTARTLVEDLVGTMTNLNGIVLRQSKRAHLFSWVFGYFLDNLADTKAEIAQVLPNRATHIQQAITSKYMRGWNNVVTEKDLC